MKKLNEPRSKPSCELVDWKSTLAPVIPAAAGIQAIFDPELKTNLDSLLMKRGIFANRDIHSALNSQR
jgi:hypothetical protein